MCVCDRGGGRSSTIVAHGRERVNALFVVVVVFSSSDVASLSSWLSLASVASDTLPPLYLIASIKFHL